MTSPLPDPVIELSGVRASYGRIEVLHGVDLKASPGEFLAMLGPNGAGKTTTLHVLAGLVQATAGHVHIAGRHVNGTNPDALARVGVCLITEGRGVFPNLSVSDNLRVFSSSGTPVSVIEERSYDRFPRLAERRNQLAGTMSGGEQRMLALARGLATDPAVLLLDELSIGLAPLIVESLYESVVESAKDGVTVIAVEQFATLVLDLADRACIMGHGKISDEGPPAMIAGRLRDAYLGGS